MLNFSTQESSNDSISTLEYARTNSRQLVATRVLQLLDKQKFTMVYHAPSELSSLELETLAIATSDAFGVAMSSVDIKNHLLECDVIGCVYANSDTPI